MYVNGVHYRTLWMEPKDCRIFYIDQNLLPFRFEVKTSMSYLSSCKAIASMAVRGAGAIGVMGGFAMAQASLKASGKNRMTGLATARDRITGTRPTASDLSYCVNLVHTAALISHSNAVETALAIASNNEAQALKIGQYGSTLIHEDDCILTHCNAGWLGFVDYGSALAPLYYAHQQGVRFKVLVSETRPRNQGARLTTWELKQAGIGFTLITDSAAAYFMQQRKVNLVITGADRIARNGDTANKIGTLTKAIVAHAFGIPFYVAAPVSTFDPATSDGDKIPIEYRDPAEICMQEVRTSRGRIIRGSIVPTGTKAANPAFDVTPARFITAFITPHGILPPSGLALFYEQHLGESTNNY